jgi:hypothetical protein
MSGKRIKTFKELEEEISQFTLEEKDEYINELLGKQHEYYSTITMFFLKSGRVIIGSVQPEKEQGWIEINEAYVLPLDVDFELALRAASGYEIEKDGLTYPIKIESLAKALRDSGQHNSGASMSLNKNSIEAFAPVLNAKDTWGDLFVFYDEVGEAIDLRGIFPDHFIRAKWRAEKENPSH